MERPEDKVIESFVRYLSEKLYPGLQIKDWPDKKKGSKGEIDATAVSCSNCIAIEHTSIDTLQNQRTDDARFLKVIVPIEQALQGRADLGALISVPFGAVPIRTNWNDIKNNLQDWIIRQVPLCPNGNSEHKVPGVPFPIRVNKSLRRNHLIFARYADNDHTFTERLASLVDEKAKKLGRYKTNGYLTIVLLENNDIANMSRGTMITAVNDVYAKQLPVTVDKIWYADTSIAEPNTFWNMTPESRRTLGYINATEEFENPAK